MHMYNGFEPFYKPPCMRIQFKALPLCTKRGVGLTNRVWVIGAAGLECAGAPCLCNKTV